MTVRLSFQFWNRKKYPVSIRRVEVHFRDTQLGGLGQPQGEAGWRAVTKNVLYNEKSFSVDPNRSHVFEVAVASQTKMSVAAEDLIAVTLAYFDPIKNKAMELAIDSDRSFVFKRTWKDRLRRPWK
jgi:hypothetical protein